MENARLTEMRTGALFGVGRVGLVGRALGGEREKTEEDGGGLQRRIRGSVRKKEGIGVDK